MDRQGGDIFMAFPQERKTNGNDVQTIIKIFSKCPLFDHLLQVPIGSGNEPDINLFGFCSSHGRKLSLLQYPQEFCLNGQADIANLIEKDRSAVGHLEKSRLGRHRTGEGSPDVTEQFALQQILGKNSAVNGHKLLVPSRAVEMDGPGDEFLPRAALSIDQHRAIRRSNFCNDPVDLLHLLALPYDVMKSVLLPQFLPQIDVFQKEVLLFNRLLHNDGDFIGSKRFGNIVKGSQLHGLDRCLHCGKTGDHDHNRIRILSPQCPEYFHAIDSWHFKVGDNDIKRILLHLPEGFRPA